jgi:hypothetical protein
MARTIVIGDLHGCLVEAQELVQKVGYRPEEDFLVFTGDLVDRGPFPVESVRWVMGLRGQGRRVECLRGNHEQKVVEFCEKEARAAAGGPKNGMERPFPKRFAEWTAFTQNELMWMATRPLWLDLGGGWLAVHAGFEPKPLSEQKEDRVTRIRWVHETTGDFVPMKHVPVLDDPDLIVKSHSVPDPARANSPEAVAKREARMKERLAKGLPPVVEQRRRPKRYTTTFEQPDHSKSWREAWPGPQNVIYGHDAQKGEPRREHNAHGATLVGIDTGCCFGHTLTAAVFIDGSLKDYVSVDAKEVYYKWPEADTSE